MKIRTELLQRMVNKVINGASGNKMIPLTSLIGVFVEKSIKSKDKSNLILVATDGSNQFRINEEIDKADDFYTVVDAETFSKLIGKTTEEFVELINKDNYLKIIGNGTYKLEIAINEEGDMVRFPDIKNIEGTELAVNLNNLQEAIKVAKASIAKTMEVPCLTGYYISNNTIATDRQMICTMNNQLINEPILISSEMAELLLLVEGDEVLDLIKQDNNLIFHNANYTIAGKELEGKENYPVQAIKELTNTSYKNSIKVNKQELLNILDRMSLFVTDYDKNGIFLKFMPDYLNIRSQKSNAEEIITSNKINNADIFECLIDIEMLKSQIETISTDEVEIHYGQEKSIKIVDGNVTHIISLLEKEN